jgi:DNA-binding MarR family transcriptional regulator
MTDNGELFTELVRAEMDLWAALERRLLAATGLTLGRYEVMRVVAAYHPQCRVADISTELGITVGAASKLVDRLEGAGLSERVPNPGDRRSSLVRLSGSGAQLHRAAAIVVRDTLRVLLAPVADEAPGLLAGLRTLRTHLRGSGAAKVSP